jgi:histone H3/H4
MADAAEVEKPEVEEADDQKSLILKSRVRAVVYGVDGRISSSAYETLNEKVKELIETARERARLNGRVTILPQDF